MSILSVNRYVVLILLILTSGGIFSITVASSCLGAAFVLFSLIYVLVNRRKITVINYQVLWFIILMTALVIFDSVLANKVDLRGSLFYVVRLFVLGLLSCYVVEEFKQFETGLINVLQAIVFISLFIYLLVTFVDMSSFLIPISDSFKVYFGFFSVFGRPIISVAGFNRLGGIFYEPGVFQFYINIFIMYCLFYRKRFSYVAALFLLFCTFSIIGYAICFMINLTYLKYRSRWLLLLCFMVFAVFVGTALIYLKMSTASFALRSGEFLSIWKNLSWFGWGVGSSGHLPFYLNGLLSYRNYSNSFFVVGVKFGVVGLLIIAAYFVMLFRNSMLCCDKSRSFLMFSWLLCVFVTLLSEGIILSNFILLYILVAGQSRVRYEKSISDMS